ncbi:MAG: hypothetical protein GY703_18450 [Gammaproteobacteria bacterium]|nr:hypothetical protein [Gammaproteobacteria bacterium]
MRTRKNTNSGWLVLASLTAALIGSAASSRVLAEENNGVLTAEILGATAIHNPAFGVSLAAKPPLSLVADGIVLASGLAQKAIPAVLEVPPDIARNPNQPGNCEYHFDLPQSKFQFGDLYGFIKLSAVGRSFSNPVVANPLTGIPDDWGDLGTPELFHQNAEVLLKVKNQHIENSFGSQTVQLPAGNHRITWQAQTLVDPVFDLAVPTALLATSIYSYMKAPAFKAALDEDAAKAVSELSGFKKAVYKLFQPDEFKKFKRLVKGNTLKADSATNTELVWAEHSRTQTFTVYDTRNPEVTVNTPLKVMEATDFGGVLFNRVRNELLADIVAVDPCERPVSLSHDIPVLLPLGDTRVTWTATDSGPNPQSERNTTTAIQTLRIQDTQAPIIVPPAGKVIEVPAGVNDLSLAEVDLGVPMVVDLADPMPIIANNAPGNFPVDTRTPVTWSATDHGFPSANTSEAEQLITIKLEGTNTAPFVGDQTGDTLTSQPIDFRLTGMDNDILDGVRDPLSFEIVDRPGSGEFIAPLYPFFIEDYRTSPGGPHGEDFYLSNNRSNWLYNNICTQPPYNSMPYNDRLQVDWVYAPKFAHVTDGGILYMIDRYWKCGASSASTYPRISKWDDQGTFLGQTGYSGTTDAFLMDQDGFIYTLSRTGGGSSTTLTLSQIRPDFDTDTTDPSGDAWRFDYNSTGDDPVSNSQYSYARVDSRQGLVYVNDRRRVFVFDIRDDLSNGIDEFKNGMDDQYLGALKNGAQFINTDNGGWGSSWTGFAMEVDSMGNLYVADTAGDRIHKFTPSYFDSEGQFVAGDYIGWMGRCESSTNKACDDSNQISKGYSCTDETCSVSGPNDRSGDTPGQFDSPTYIALDPNDTLYVADYGNSRIQRFAPDGTFAGEALSTGTGISQGEHPSFVLGNMGQPKSVSVNSTQFYIVDTDESFVHVFETTPFKEITDESVTVTYVSNFNFHTDTDTFRYRATDGLAQSNTGTVSINVVRNYRPPVAFDGGSITEEDTSVPILLEADDPDGILGVDFNGLDTLSYEIVIPPGHGSLTGSGNERTYHPDPDYYGTDSFTFIANDGLDDSLPARFDIQVTPVNDPPRITAMTLPQRISIGFPIMFTGEYEDDGSEQAHEAYVFWGDTEDVNGDFSNPDGAEGEEPPVLNGIKVLEPAARTGRGSVIAQHTYTGVGDKTVFYCMGDDAGQACDQQTVSVEHLVNLAVKTTLDKEAVIADSAQLEIEIRNGLPEGVAGLTAENVQLTQVASEYLQVTGLTTQPGGCGLVDGLLNCDAGNLAPDATYKVTVTVAPRKPVIFDVIEPLFVEVTSSSETVQSLYSGIASITVQADPADFDEDGMTDVYELAYGLNPESDTDADQHSDGDGLTNIQEFELRTHPRRSDTDGDGLNDSKELDFFTDPLLADTDDDGINDKQELDNGLNPRDFNDAEEDPDGDGLINRGEVELGTLIGDEDTDNDDALDSVDNCPLISNADQMNSDSDSAGNACDPDDDNDGIPDEVEISAGLNPQNPADAVLDRDGDGVRNIDEFLDGTDLNEVDSDGDGVTDYEERSTKVLQFILINLMD